MSQARDWCGPVATKALTPVSTSSRPCPVFAATVDESTRSKCLASSWLSRAGRPAKLDRPATWGLPRTAPQIALPSPAPMSAATSTVAPSSCVTTAANAASSALNCARRPSSAKQARRQERPQAVYSALPVSAPRRTARSPISESFKYVLDVEDIGVPGGQRQEPRIRITARLGELQRTLARPASIGAGEGTPAGDHKLGRVPWPRATGRRRRAWRARHGTSRGSVSSTASV